MILQLQDSNLIMKYHPSLILISMPTLFKISLLTKKQINPLTLMVGLSSHYKKQHYKLVPLLLLFKKSFQQKIIPDGWKCGHITPIHKKGCRHSCNNYRPVSLTLPIMKVMEYIIKDNIFSYMCNNNLFSTWFYHKKVLY